MAKGAKSPRAGEPVRLGRTYLALAYSRKEAPKAA